jgi:hypothetical protein
MIGLDASELVVRQTPFVRLQTVLDAYAERYFELRFTKPQINNENKIVVVAYVAKGLTALEPEELITQHFTYKEDNNRAGASRIIADIHSFISDQRLTLTEAMARPPTLDVKGRPVRLTHH